MDPILERYQALEDKIRSYQPNFDQQLLYSAFTYADNAHRGQMRLLVIDKADQPRRTNHAKENKRCKHRQQPP